MTSKSLTLDDLEGSKRTTVVQYANRAVFCLNGKSQKIGDGTSVQGGGDVLYAVSSNHVSFCSGLAAVVNEMFQALSGYISETVPDKTQVIINH